MAHTPEYLNLTVSWDHPGLREALETIIAKAWADGFRTGVNDEREGRGPFGSDVVAARYRDWRGYGPGAQHPGGAYASAAIRAQDGTTPVKQPSETWSYQQLSERLAGD